jgi:hypothetical protein
LVGEKWARYGWMRRDAREVLVLLGCWSQRRGMNMRRVIIIIIIIIIRLDLLL